MKHCTNFEELISAYVDDELGSSDKLHLEEHLRSCRGCLNLLALYHGMSVSMAESYAEPPASLRGNVMDVINNPSAIGIVTPSYQDEIDEEIVARTKKRKLMRTVLTRYAPIAACLAIALLVLPQFLNIDRSANETATPIAPTALPEMAYDEVMAGAAFGDGEDLVLAEEDTLDDSFISPDAQQDITDVDAAEGRAMPADAPPVADGELRAPQESGWSMYDSLLESEYVATAGYFAFIMIAHEFTDTFPLVTYFNDYYLLEQIDVASFIEQYEAYIVYFVPGDEAAEFALVQFVV